MAFLPKKNKKEDKSTEKTTEKKVFRCKHCGDEFPTVPELAQHSKVCEAAIEARAKEPKKKVKKKEKKPEDEKQVPSQEKKEERPSVFKKPKTPSEILEGVCEEHQLNAKFIDLVVKRSERVGGIHPVDFRRMLTELDSGIGKAKAEADYIADDYYYALQQSQKNAEDAGYRMSYPLDVRGETRENGYRRPFSESRRDEPPYERDRYHPPSERGYTPPSGYRKAFGGAELTKEDVVDIVTDALTKKRQEDKIDELYKKMDERDKKRDEEMKEFMQETRSATSTPVDVKPPDTVTKEDLTHMFEKKDASETIKAQEERLKMEKELRVAERKAQDEKHKDLIDDIRTLKDEIKNKPANISTEGYKDDSIRLLADTLQTVVPGRYPIRDGLKIVFSPITGEKERPKREKIDDGESSIFDNLPADLISEE